jgi:hypothetical protein
MKIALTGATGFVGRKLIARLLAGGHELHVVGRRQPGHLAGQVRFHTWDAFKEEPPLDALEGAGAVINLAGEPVAQRWTAAAKLRIQASRVEGTNAVTAAFARLARKPGALLAASAIGYYGDRGDEVLREDSPPGVGFLPETCVRWEEANTKAEQLGVRVVKFRIGLVLGAEGGALKKMLPPFRIGLGGRLGSGRQWMSWIHLDDLVGMILFALERDHIRGPINATSPNPVRNSAFTRALGNALRRPAVFPVPAFALKLLFGEMSGILLDSQRVEPAAAMRSAFPFKFFSLAAALENILRPPAGDCD